MSAPTDGGPAFPHANPVYDGNWDKRQQIGGMSLRDWFAGQAIAPLLTGAVLPTKEDRDKYLPIAATIAYEIADAMISARNAADGSETK